MLCNILTTVKLSRTDDFLFTWTFWNLRTSSKIWNIVLLEPWDLSIQQMFKRLFPSSVIGSKPKKKQLNIVLQNFIGCDWQSVMNKHFYCLGWSVQANFLIFWCGCTLYLDLVFFYYKLSQINLLYLKFWFVLNQEQLKKIQDIYFELWYIVSDPGKYYLIIYFHQTQEILESAHFVNARFMDVELSSSYSS